ALALTLHAAACTKGEARATALVNAADYAAASGDPEQALNLLRSAAQTGCVRVAESILDRLGRGDLEPKALLEEERARRKARHDMPKRAAAVADARRRIEIGLELGQMAYAEDAALELEANNSNDLLAFGVLRRTHAQAGETKELVALLRRQAGRTE